ncbi:hypothetical protein MCB86_02520, partial [Pseudomonas sp. KSR10]|uniref:hypothetical protein n=1 Tax=Pseudomonas sp. KSR10 TaxID=2916654 RepID=UPI001EF96C27
GQNRHEAELQAGFDECLLVYARQCQLLRPDNGESDTAHLFFKCLRAKLNRKTVSQILEFKQP